MPKAYVKRVRWTQNIATMVGPGFVAVGLLFAVPMMVNKLWLPLLAPAFFVLGGVSMFRYGWKIAKARLRAFRIGKAVKGSIYQVGWDTSQHINGRYPSRVVYHFTAEGQQHEGIITTFDTTAARLFAGQPVWVLYNEAEPTENAVYPPSTI
ncbi:MAG: hypothetical protein R3F19_06730 [Verrucomicrobiales bacterium]